MSRSPISPKTKIGPFTVLRLSTQPPSSTGHRYYLTHCGECKKLHTLTSHEIHRLRHCPNAPTLAAQYVGKKVGGYKILSEIVPARARHKNVRAQCLNCNTVYDRRIDALVNSTPLGCESCFGRQRRT